MFTAVHAAFPRFVRSASALDAVRLLIEMLADDAALARHRTHSPGPRARRVRGIQRPRRRAWPRAARPPCFGCERLGGRGNSIAVAVAAYLAVAAMMVVPTVAVAVPWLVELSRLFIA